MNLKKIQTIPHIEMVRNLAREIWNEHYIKILSKAQIDYMLDLIYSTEKIQQEIKDGISWEMLWEKDEPIGFLVCKIELEKIYISKIYLKAETRGKGLGKFLLNRTQDLAKQLEKKFIYLNVNKYNVSSIKFYERNGFKKVNEDVIDIGNGFVMDDFIYELEIDK